MENVTGIGGRIKKLRLKKEYTQEEFGKRIGSARNTVANYESENRIPGNAVIALICKEFEVNEVWLRTGEGGDNNMFIKVNQEDLYSISLGKLTMTENQFIQNAIIALAKTEPEKLKIIEEFMKNCLGLN